MTDIPGVILAGGQSRRMGGGDKCLLMLGDRALLAHVIDRLAPQVSNMAINANGDAGRFAETGLPVIADTVQGFVGPLAGVLAAMEWAAGLGAQQVVTVAADTPRFPKDLVEGFLRAGHNGAPITLAATRDPDRGVLRHPTFGMWSVDLRDDLRRALEDGTRKVVAWTDPHGAATAIFESARRDPFFNINTAQDLEIAQSEQLGRT